MSRGLPASTVFQGSRRALLKKRRKQAKEWRPKSGRKAKRWGR